MGHVILVAGAVASGVMARPARGEGKSLRE